MRAPNHLAIKQQCLRSIANLMKKYNLGLPESIIVDDTGWVNPCFFVDRKFVFRFNARDKGLPKFQREKLVFDLLENSSLPIPRQVLLDDSCEIAPFDVLITPMLPGSTVEQDWPMLNSQQRGQLAENAGKLLIQIHGVPFPFFGELTGRGPLPRTDTWIDYLRAKLSFHLDQAINLGIFDPKLGDRFMAVFQAHSDLLNEVTSAQLVHVDYHFGNLLHVESEVTGILDFEWAFAGDPLYDFSQWIAKDELWPGSQAPLLRGCGRTGFSDSEKRRIDLYQMIRNIELCPVAELYFGTKESIEYRQATEAHLHRLENNIIGL